MSEYHGREGPVLVIGSSGLDIVGRASRVLQSGTSNPGRLRMSNGGVARNIAEALSRLGMPTALITVVGEDAPGQRLLEETARAGVETSPALCLPEARTGAYLAVLDAEGNLQFGLDDMHAVQNLSPSHLQQRRKWFKQASAIVVDANLTPRTMNTAMSLARQYEVPVVADPTSVSLAPRLKPHLNQLWLVTPNEAEAETLCPHPVPHADRDRVIDAARHLVSEGVEIAIITMAEYGVGYATANASGHVPAVKTEVLDPTGAHDALTATVLFALLNDIPLDEAVRLGVSAAALTLRQHGTVAPDLSLELLYDQLR
jgi:pseudouridine kinase